MRRLGEGPQEDQLALAWVLYAIIFAVFTVVLLILEIIYAWPYRDFHGMAYVAISGGAAGYFTAKALRRKRRGGGGHA